MAHYQFELDQRSLYQVLGGLVVSLFLAFGAGLVVGLRLQLPDDLASDSAATETEQTEVTTEASPEDYAPSTSSADSTPDGGAERSAQRDDREATGGGMNDSDDPESTGTADAGETSSSAADAMERSSGGSAPDEQRPTPSSSGSISAPYTVQLGRFGEREEAQALVRRVQRDDHTSVIKPERRDGETVYQVWVGEYDSFSEAAEELSTFRQYASGAFVERTN